MARVVAAFGTSHSTMLFSSRENWQAMFDHVDCRAPIYYFEGKPRSFEELLKSTPVSAPSKISAVAQAETSSRQRPWTPWTVCRSAIAGSEARCSGHRRRRSA